MVQSSVFFLNIMMQDLLLCIIPTSGNVVEISSDVSLVSSVDVSSSSSVWKAKHKVLITDYILQEIRSVL